MTDALLQNRRVLVVEDEYMIAEAMSRNLRRAGAIVLGPVSDVEGALGLLDEEAAVDGAVLDINLGEQKVYPVVDALLARGARCVFATGNDPTEVPAAYASLTRCEKPIDPSCIVNALSLGDRLDTTADHKGSNDDVAVMREQLKSLLRLADDMGASLLAAKLCEALDAVDDIGRR